MANTLQVKRGTKANLPTLAQGEVGYCTDTGEAYIGTGSGNKSLNIHFVECRLVEKSTNVAVATSVGGDFRIPVAVTVLSVGAYVDTAGTTNATAIDINEGGTSILSTTITIDSTQKTSVTATTPPVISDSAIAADGIITFDVDSVSTTAPKGLVVWLKVVFTQ